MFFLWLFTLDKLKKLSWKNWPVFMYNFPILCIPLLSVEYALHEEDPYWSWGCQHLGGGGGLPELSHGGPGSSPAFLCHAWSNRGPSTHQVCLHHVGAHGKSE